MKVTYTACLVTVLAIGVAYTTVDAAPLLPQSDSSDDLQAGLPINRGDELVPKEASLFADFDSESGYFEQKTYDMDQMGDSNGHILQRDMKDFEETGDGYESPGNENSNSASLLGDDEHVADDYWAKHGGEDNGYDSDEEIGPDEGLDLSDLDEFR
ncbi:hypothetical protein H4R35_004626 [Dimargaris xerosporica]|nr:hypothetical protein H4R35_004626 [Dimargaris xerosporica]